MTLILLEVSLLTDKIVEWALLEKYSHPGREYHRDVQFKELEEVRMPSPAEILTSQEECDLTIWSAKPKPFGILNKDHWVPCHAFCSSSFDYFSKENCMVTWLFYTELIFSLKAKFIFRCTLSSVIIQTIMLTTPILFSFSAQLLICAKFVEYFDDIDVFSPSRFIMCFALVW